MRELNLNSKTVKKPSVPTIVHKLMKPTGSAVLAVHLVNYYIPRTKLLF